jgi:hypothetical protein
MSEKRTKADTAQREADQLEEKSSRRPPRIRGKKHVRISAKPLCGSWKKLPSKSELDLRLSIEQLGALEGDHLSQAQ